MRSWRKKIEKEIEKQFDIEIPLDEPIYPLNIVCKILKMHSWTVNEIVKMRLVHPKKVGKRKKLFSYRNIQRLRYIKYLMEDKGVNIKGIKVIFEMEKEI